MLQNSMGFAVYNRFLIDPRHTVLGVNFKTLYMAKYAKKIKGQILSRNVQFLNLCEKIAKILKVWKDINLSLIYGFLWTANTIMQR